VGEIARSSKWCPVQRLGATTEEPKVMDWGFFLVPKRRPAEKSLDPLLSTMEFQSNIRSQIVLHPLHPWLLWKGSFENDGTWCWWNLLATTEARCNPKCAPSITWPGEKKWRNSSCSTPAHSQGSTTEASKGRGMWFLTLQYYTCTKASR
jgi:hypothetical protein